MVVGMAESKGLRTVQAQVSRANGNSHAKSLARRKGAVRSTFITKTGSCLLKFGCSNCPIAMRPCGFCFPLVTLILAMPLKRRLLGIYNSWARTAPREGRGALFLPRYELLSV